MSVIRGVLFLGLVGCSGDEDSDKNTGFEDVDPEVVLGTGEAAWEDLEDSDEIFIVQGPQGGHHLLGSMRVKGIRAGNSTNISDLKNPTTRFRATIAGEQLAGDASYTQGLDLALDNDEGWTHAMIGRFVILDIRDDSDIIGETVLFEVEVEDHDGIVVRDSLELTVIRHPLNN